MISMHRMADAVDYGLCRIGLLNFPTWQKVCEKSNVQLYAGKLRRGLPQYKTHYGITPFYASTRNIWHDASEAYPISDNSVDIYQSEDVFEHIPIERIPKIFNEIYRVLKPGGVFRLSLPDYNFSAYRDRSIKDNMGNIVFDPDGGGDFIDGKVVNGGHLWFPTINSVRNIFIKSDFGNRGLIDYLQFNTDDGDSIINKIDYTIGHIQRSAEFDPRGKGGTQAVSIIIDARKL